MGSKKSKETSAESKARRAKAREEALAEDKAVEDASREEIAAAVEEEARIEYVEQPPTPMTRIEIDVAVNGLPAGQRLTVSADHPFYAGLLAQKMAHVVEEDEG
jgi:hypothetical protein